MNTTDRIKELFSVFSTEPITAFNKLPQAGSERHYFRIHTASKSFIATYGANIKENETFIYFSEHFSKKNLATPKILSVNKEKDIYIQEDFG
ncbi:MAG: aminoglycoside phosphotransferase, partial [Flavobacterium sp.]